MSHPSQPPQWDPRYGPPPNPYAPPYYMPGNYSQLPPRSTAPAILGLGALAGILASLMLALPASFVFGWLVDGTSLQDFMRSQLEPLARLPIPLILISLMLGALQGIVIALPRIGIADRVAYIALAIIGGSLIGLAIDLFLVDPLTGIFSLARTPIEWLRLLCYNLPLALGAGFFIGLSTR